MLFGSEIIPRSGKENRIAGFRFTMLGSPPEPAARSCAPALLTIGALTLLAFHNGFSGPFIFDDGPSIAENATIRRLWPLHEPLNPPDNGSSVTGRPIVNLSFALNYALGGMRVEGYHATNVAIHLLAGLTLFGIVRRTLLRPQIPERCRAAARPLALAVAAIWAVHPLQTESVTFVVQRTESLMGLWYFLTLYCFVRGNEATVAARGWLALMFAVCLLGMGTKEIMVSAPLAILLYDRTFVAGTFRAAWRQRWRWHVALASTWLVLGYLVASGGANRLTTSVEASVASWTYALKQCEAIVHYLCLSLWPHPLVIDYGVDVVTQAAIVAPQGFLLVALVAVTLLALRYRPPIGFAGAWFFMTLAPSSSVVPLLTQTMAEHRMYLPLAALATLAVLGIHAAIGRRILVVSLALATSAAMLAARRNHDYRSALAIWSDTAVKRPENPRAHLNLGRALLKADRPPKAIARFETALRLKPDYAIAHFNLGNALAANPKQRPEAIIHYEQALRLAPRYHEAHNNLGNVLAGMPGRLTDAKVHYEAALRSKADYAQAHQNLGNVLAKLGAPLSQVIACFEAALRFKSDFAEAHNNLASILEEVPGRLDQAIAHYERASQLAPRNADIRYNLGNALMRLPQRRDDAIAHYEAALQSRHDDAEIHQRLGVALIDAPGRRADARAHLETALRLKPDFSAAEQALADLRTRTLTTTH